MGGTATYIKLTADASEIYFIQYVYTRLNIYIYILKIHLHSSCEIEYFVETHLCKLCVILQSRVLRVVCLGRRLPLQLQQCSYQGQQGEVRQSVRI